MSNPTGRTIIVIECTGDSILQSELDVLSDDWTLFGMPRGKYALHQTEIKQLTDEVRKIVSKYNKPSSEGRNMSSSSWKNLYHEGDPVALGLVEDIDDTKAIIRAKELAKEIDKDFWVYRAASLYWAYEHYPKFQKPIAHVYPAGRIEWRTKNE